MLMTEAGLVHKNIDATLFKTDLRRLQFLRYVFHIRSGNGLLRTGDRCIGRTEDEDKHEDENDRHNVSRSQPLSFFLQPFDRLSERLHFQLLMSDFKLILTVSRVRRTLAAGEKRSSYLTSLM
jgi:hypothetical protein